MSRTLYRLILRLYPAGFRDRFAAEMLWIYDESGQPLAFLADGLRSLLRQHARPAHPQPALAGFGALDTSSGVTPRRLLEASAAATLLLAFLLILLGHPPRLPALPACPPGTPK